MANDERSCAVGSASGEKYHADHSGEVAVRGVVEPLGEISNEARHRCLADVAVIHRVRIIIVGLISHNHLLTSRGRCTRMRTALCGRIWLYIGAATGFKCARCRRGSRRHLEMD